MRVGALVGDFLPDAGGGYTFVTDVFAALLEHAGASAHEFVGLCTAGAAPRWSTAAQASTVSITAIGSEPAYARVLREITEPFSAIARRISPEHAIDAAARAHRLDAVWFLGGGAGVALDTPYIATVWDLQHRTHPHFPEISAQGRWRERENSYSIFLRRAARIISGTRAGADEIKLFYGIPDERIFLIPHPTPRAYLEPAGHDERAATALREKFGLAERFLLYPANFWAHKNHVNLLRGFKLAYEKHPEIQLVLVGDNKGNREFVMHTAARLGLAGAVKFPGLVPLDELKLLYRLATALSYASFSGPENMPPLEAFASGCPVLNSDFPGAREQLGDAALFFEPHDPTAIAAAMIDLLESEELRSQLIAAGHIRARRTTAADFVAASFKLLDQFESERRCWP